MARLGIELVSFLECTIELSISYLFCKVNCLAHQCSRRAYARRDMSFRRAKRLLQGCILLGFSCIAVVLWRFDFAVLNFSNLSARPKKAVQLLTLNEHECRASFPGLFDDIDSMVGMGPFELKPTQGMVQAKIKDGQVRMSLYVRNGLRLRLTLC